VAKFTFKLEGVLEQRKHAERQRQREVAAVQHKLLRLRAELDALVAVKRTSAAALRAAGRTLTAAALAAHQRFAAAMRQKATTLDCQTSDARAELGRARDALLEAAKQRKVMEKLRERTYAHWLLGARKRADADADELAHRSEAAAGFDASI
jgi:flagellar FliJ protein